MSKKYDKMVIWPVYIDSERTRGAGRAISRRHAITNPKSDEILMAALEMNLEPELERDKCYPKQWWDKKGRVLVLKKGSKNSVLREIARAIKSIRG